MQTYTEIDIAGYKAALARYQAKYNSLVAKYSDILNKTVDCASEVESLTISDARNAELEFLCAIKKIYRDFIVDLETPADMFLTDFEMRGCR